MATALETEITPYVLNHFIAGKSVSPASGEYLDKLDPRTGLRIARVANGNQADVDSAVRGSSLSRYSPDAGETLFPAMKWFST